MFVHKSLRIKAHCAAQHGPQVTTQSADSCSSWISRKLQLDSLCHSKPADLITGMALNLDTRNSSIDSSATLTLTLDSNPYTLSSHCMKWHASQWPCSPCSPRHCSQTAHACTTTWTTTDRYTRHACITVRQQSRSDRICLKQASEATPLKYRRSGSSCQSWDVSIYENEMTTLSISHSMIADHGDARMADSHKMTKAHRAKFSESPSICWTPDSRTALRITWPSWSMRRSCFVFLWMKLLQAPR